MKPVVSDFDTFTIGSKGMDYAPTPAGQVELIHWALDHTKKLLEGPKGRRDKGWSSCWLQVLKQAASDGFSVELPPLGFGDPTSYRLIDEVVKVTEQCGAVRHGAECFNFYFPQELDEEFLVVWDGFQNPPWKSFKEPELRQFLIERCRDGYCFPINPVWPVRDKGWWEVMEALGTSAEGRRNLEAWFPPSSGVVEKIEEIRTAHPRGFKDTDETDKLKTGTDLSGNDVVYFALAQVHKAQAARWKRIRRKLIAQLKLQGAIGS